MYKVALLTLQFECYASLNIAHVLAFDTGFLEAYSRLFEEEPDTNTLTSYWRLRTFTGIREPDRWKRACDTIKDGSAN